jgi:hypothetical protein
MIRDFIHGYFRGLALWIFVLIIIAFATNNPLVGLLLVGIFCCLPLGLRKGPRQ